MIPEATLAQIQERTDIVELISSFVPLKRAGRNFKGLCPFHPEKTPSFMVSPDKQIFHCFGCGAGGNAIGFFMKIEKRDFREAAEILAERAGIEIPKDAVFLRGASEEAEALLRCHELAAKFYHQYLMEAKEAAPARDYLRRRGVQENMIREFHLGLAPNAWDSFYRSVKGQAPDKILEKAGLVVRGKESGYYDRFRNRVLFPIADAKGRVIAFGGRVLDDALPKYLNSPETEIYSKGRHLFGLHEARQAIRELDAVAVVEGYMDVIACHQAGVRHVVASLGTALTPEQARLLKRHTKNIVMVYDADRAGEMATLRGLEIFLEEGLEVKIVRLPEGHDPDTFVGQYGGEEFRKTLSEAKSLFDYKLSVLKRTHSADTVEGRVKIADEMVRLFAKVRNEILRDAWMKELSRALAISEEALLAELRKSGRASAPKPFSAPPSERDGASAAEKLLLGLLLDSSDFRARVRQEIGPEDFQHPLIRRVAKKVLEEIREEGPAEVLLRFGEDHEAVQIICLAAVETARLETAAETEKCFSDCLVAMKRLRIRAEREGLRTQIMAAEQEGNRNRIAKLMYDLEALNKKDREIHAKK